MTTYGVVFALSSSEGRMRPTASETASAARPVRHHASIVRSTARRVRWASLSSSSVSKPDRRPLAVPLPAGPLVAAMPVAPARASAGAPSLLGAPRAAAAPQPATRAPGAPGLLVLFPVLGR